LSLFPWRSVGWFILVVLLFTSSLPLLLIPLLSMSSPLTRMILCSFSTLPVCHSDGHFHCLHALSVSSVSFVVDMAVLYLKQCSTPIPCIHALFRLLITPTIHSVLPILSSYIPC
jgi:hypothetical protein